MARTHSPTAIDYPDCRKCGTRTRVVSIEQGKPGYDKRTFICSECNHAEIVFVKYESGDGRATASRTGALGRSNLP
jgi:transcription elongation factor Elf1